MKCFCLLNHTLTEKQIAELKNDWHCDEIVYPSDDLAYDWGHIPATKELEFSKVFNLIHEWFYNNKLKAGDIVIIQGEMGITYALIEHVKNLRAIPIYAVSERRSKDEKMVDGSTKKTSYFEHVCFRKYEPYSDLLFRKQLEKKSPMND